MPARSTTLERATEAGVRPPREGVRLAEVRVLGAIAGGGVLGALARYGIGEAMPASDGFPWATLLVNVIGSFALGALLILLAERFPPNRYLRPFAATGLLGAFTTYSTFAADTVLLLRDGRPAAAVTYVVLSLALGLAAAGVGVVLARNLRVRVA